MVRNVLLHKIHVRKNPAHIINRVWEPVRACYSSPAFFQLWISNEKCGLCHVRIPHLPRRMRRTARYLIRQVKLLIATGAAGQLILRIIRTEETTSSINCQQGDRFEEI